MIEVEQVSRRDDAGARYMVLCSLPHIERFDRTSRLPIGAETLAARLALLPAGDAREISLATSLLGWPGDAMSRPDAAVIADFERVSRTAGTRGLRDLADFQLGLRIVVAALRRRRAGLQRPPAGDRWSMTSLGRHVQRHFDEPDFRLQHVLPWVPVARRLLDDGKVAECERLLFGLVWTRLEAMRCADRFGSDALLAYVFKWDLVDRWLGRNPVSAAQAFETLAQEALGAFSQPFVR